jgi:hypothetical protein
VRYSPLTDTLLLYFYGGPEPAINVNVEDSSMYLMVVPDTDELVGVHIQGFTRRFLPDHPLFQAVDVTKWASPDQERESDISKEDIALQKSLAEMVVGSLVIEYGLRAA